MMNETFLLWIGRSLRHVHLLIAIVTIAVTFLIPKQYLKYVTGYWILIIVMNLYKGCPISSLEYWLTQENIIITDVPLKLLGYDINDKNRKLMTIVIGGAMLLISVFRQ